jgi:hypothetical protein
VLGLFAGALGLMGNVWVTYSNNRNSQQIERLRSQSNLVVDAIKTSQENACKNLVFLVELGLIDDPNKAIREACKKDSNQAPSLPPVFGGGGNFTGWQSAISIRGIVEDEKTGAPIPQAKISMPLGEMAITDEKGQFSIPTLGGFLAKIYVEKNGYKPMDMNIDVGPVAIIKMQKIN